MNTTIALAGAVVALVLTVTLVREIRVRRALQTLLTRIAHRWRDKHDETHLD